MLSVSKGSEVTLDQAVAGKRVGAVPGSYQLLLSVLSETLTLAAVSTQSDTR